MSTEENKEIYSEAEWMMITNFITGNCSDEEKSHFQRWMDEAPFRKKEIELLQKSYLPDNTEVPEGQVQKAWNDVTAAIGNTKKEQAVTRGNSLRKFSLNILKAAAVLSLLFATYFIGRQLNLFRINSEAGLVIKEKVTDLGEKAIITMSDGTTVVLNADSKLTYPNNFSAERRELTLQGEAFFDVAHDSAKPFIVHSGELSTTVLGTKFNVTAFPKEEKITISLVEGKVKVSNGKSNTPDDVIVLKPMQELAYDQGTNINTVDNFDLLERVGWKDNLLKFKNEPLESVLIKLERAYGIKFELTEKSFNKFKITGNFHNESYYTISESLKKLTGLQYKTIKENNTVKKIVFFKK